MIGRETRRSSTEIFLAVTMAEKSTAPKEVDAEQSNLATTSVPPVPVDTGSAKSSAAISAVSAAAASAASTASAAVKPDTGYVRATSIWQSTIKLEFTDCFK